MRDWSRRGRALSWYLILLLSFTPADSHGLAYGYTSGLQTGQENVDLFKTKTQLILLESKQKQSLEHG